jgi:CO/xanthine dehydrogenase FAD-binding subunit
MTRSGCWPGAAPASSPERRTFFLARERVRCVDVSNISAMRGVCLDNVGVRIGAATTWSEIARADLPPAFDALKVAARDVGAVQIQNRGTIAGNLCNASPAADGAPPLLILDAEVELASRRGTRRLALDAFINGARTTLLAPDEVMTAIVTPLPSSTSSRGLYTTRGSPSALARRSPNGCGKRSAV